MYLVNQIKGIVFAVDKLCEAVRWLVECEKKQGRLGWLTFGFSFLKGRRSLDADMNC